MTVNEQEIQFLRSVIEDQKRTIEALNDKIGGPGSTTTENLRTPNLRKLDAYFQSGNHVPVGQATIKREEWLMVKRDLLELENEVFLSREYRTIMAEAYQVIGVLADKAGLMEHPSVIGCMDNLSLEQITCDTVLPFLLVQGETQYADQN